MLACIHKRAYGGLPSCYIHCRTASSCSTWDRPRYKNSSLLIIMMPPCLMLLEDLKISGILSADACAKVGPAEDLGLRPEALPAVSGQHAAKRQVRIASKLLTALQYAASEGCAALRAPVAACGVMSNRIWIFAGRSVACCWRRCKRSLSQQRPGGRSWPMRRPFSLLLQASLSQ